MVKINLNSNWKLSQVSENDTLKGIKATVPGSVYGDLLNAGLMEDPFWKDPDAVWTNLAVWSGQHTVIDHAAD